MVGLKVFGQPASTEVSRVLTCLIEKNLEFQLIRIDSFKREHKIPEFLQLQDPSGQVTFREGDLTLIDSRKIIRHLCDKYADQGNKKLYGNGSLEKASIEQWLQAEAQNFGPPSTELVFHLAFAKPLGKEPNMSIIEENEKRLSDILDVYDQRLGNNAYLAGDEFTLADLSHLPNTHYLVTRCERGKKLFTERKNVARWVEDITNLKSWKKVTEMQNEHPGPLEK
ncbi:hypothetical protein LUZ63_010386 [Rhynchospora breviuscula]|uniref:glutathione transferase n=1 Tax=Rhynchospora breviuscula TaxID=2022672 RepID=A0A9Q0HPX7_9POAL|nr:hypothetical protein LUZ63_010386 [Rhynchospora breviuscula]